ncbi:amidohydrolase [Mycetocola tolaasinivorans]|uniref:Amidohydrolase n=1 Tax=Mycetocola tolaasinivorans TaxID=76635 RepID=A0A3L7AEW2_9MICO|nr:amidohydrolase [Mycetocola tolaasinivorans]RLP77932.1 amidohydrolase [Mycetocola tolaasinivorans]
MAPHSISEFEDIYRDLHAHPELGFHEVRTAGIVATTLRSLGYEVTEGVGRTGVVGILERGPGATVLLRADMDALPVREETGLDYASTAIGTAADGTEVPLMHACGHDMHVTALLGAAATLAADPEWSGRLMLVFQPAEEQGSGARTMIEDGLFERFGRPDVVLGQHVAPLPAGVFGVRPGPAFAASDSLRVTLFGRGGHGSRPETTVDPVVLAASVILRLQTIVSREVAGTETAVVTVGAVHAGSAPNIIPDSAVLSISVRSVEPAVRTRVLAAIERIVKGEALAAGADREPLVEHIHSYPTVVNDPEATARVQAALQASIPGVLVIDPGLVTGSEDVGMLAQAAGVPCMYWILGGGDPANFAGLSTPEEIAQRVSTLPSNHSPLFAPAITPTLPLGIQALVSAARAWLIR